MYASSSVPAFEVAGGGALEAEVKREDGKTVHRDEPRPEPLGVPILNLAIAERRN